MRKSQSVWGHSSDKFITKSSLQKNLWTSTFKYWPEAKPQIWTSLNFVWVRNSTLNPHVNSTDGPISILGQTKTSNWTSPGIWSSKTCLNPGSKPISNSYEGWAFKIVLILICVWDSYPIKAMNESHKLNRQGPSLAMRTMTSTWNWLQAWDHSALGETRKG